MLATRVCKSQAQVVVRFRNASQLRKVTIPAEIMQGQKDFLKSLDADEKVKPGYRKYRFDLIADGEEHLGRRRRWPSSRSPSISIISRSSPRSTSMRCVCHGCPSNRTGPGRKVRQVGLLVEQQSSCFMRRALTARVLLPPKAPPPRGVRCARGGRGARSVL
jgi:hypothetical protein